MLVKGFHVMMHLNLGRQGHQYKRTGQIESPGHDLHGKTIFIETFSPKKGKGEPWVSVYLEGKDSPAFDDLAKFIEHYKIPKAEKPASANE